MFEISHTNMSFILISLNWPLYFNIKYQRYLYIWQNIAFDRKYVWYKYIFNVKYIFGINIFDIKYRNIWQYICQNIFDVNIYSMSNICIWYKYIWYKIANIFDLLYKLDTINIYSICIYFYKQGTCICTGF